MENYGKPMSFVVQDGFGIPESKERVFLSCNSHVFYFYLFLTSNVGLRVDSVGAEY